MSRLGVVVPSWNSGATLPWTLLSLAAQEGISLDTLVADSGSTDGSLATCERFGIRVLFEPPGNMYRAVNAGLRSLDCAWLTYLNADDVVYADAYARLVDAGERTGADVVYGDCDYVDWSGRFMYSVAAAPPILARRMYRLALMPFNQPCAVFRRELFERLGGFDDSYRSIADLDFFSRAAHGGAGLYQIRNFPVVAFRLHGGQISARQYSLGQDEVRRYLSQLVPQPGMLDRVAAWRWRGRNAARYLGRRLRTGRWGGRPLEGASPAPDSMVNPLEHS